MKTKQAGFTLVEIAIVLVIIGLLLGGILKGQEMITQAKIKNVISDMTGLSAALYSYQDRYRALPGDDKSANSRWSAAASGDGNGVLTGLYNTTTAGDETALFWQHLRLAGFVGGSANTDQPFNAVSGKIGVQTGKGTLTGGAVDTALGSAAVAADPGPPAVAASPAVPGFTSLILCSANLPDKLAISVDAQSDDGLSRSGAVRAQEQAGVANPAVATTAAASYQETGTYNYLVCKTLF